MSATTPATLPRTVGNELGSVFNKANNFFQSAKENVLAFVSALREVLTTDEENETAVRKLYRLSNGGDSINPQVLEALRKA